MSFDNQNKIIRQNNPIDYIEEHFSRFFDNILRDSEDKVTINAKGLWNTYKISIIWSETKKIFEICTYLDNSRKTRTSNSVYLLISKVNEKTGLGHFNFNPKLNTIFFNHKASVKGQDSITIEQVEHFVDIAVQECDRFFPVFYVFFNKKRALKMLLRLQCWKPAEKREKYFTRWLR